MRNSTIERNQKKIEEELYRKKEIWKTPSNWGFAVLQRWNSFTPAMAASEGGGYFLFHSDDDGKIDLGIVIDPGYGYVKNFLGAGFGITDINAILVSHNHPDHLADFVSIVNLLIEARKDRARLYSGKLNDITAGLSGGAYRNLLQVVDDAKSIFRDTKLLEPNENGKNIDLEIPSGSDPSLKVKISPRISYHSDSSDCDSIGFLIRLEDGNHENSNDENKYHIGLPCDTKWDKDLFEYYKGCNLILLHLDSLTPGSGEGEGFFMFDYFDEKKTSRRIVYDKRQLYLPGLFWACDELRKCVKDNRCTVILSEFGEELRGGLRADIAGRLEEHFDTQKVKFIAGDVGLVVDPLRHMIRCSCCDNYADIKHKFDCIAFGHSEQMFYVCPNCTKTLSIDQKHHIFREKLIPKPTLISV